MKKLVVKKPAAKKTDKAKPMKAKPATLPTAPVADQIAVTGTAEVAALKPSPVNSLASKLAGVKSAAIPHLIVEARAGTGKSTTLIEGLKVLRGMGSNLVPSPQQAAVWESMKLSPSTSSVCMVAFNKSIATELQSRVPAGCSAMTMHSMGFKAVQAQFGRVSVNQYRVSDIISEVTGKDIAELRRYDMEFLKGTESLVGLVKMNLADTDTETLSKLAAHYGVEMNGSADKIFAIVPAIIERCKEVTKDNAVDFDDMVWLAVALDLPVIKYDLLLVDECLPGWTPVMLADGRSMTIQEIVESPNEIRVRSYNTKNGTSKNCSVIAKQKILNQKPLVKVKVKHLHKTNGNRKANFVVCTVDHKLWTVNRGWIAAGDIRVGDDVIIETAAKTTQKGKITQAGRKHLAKIQTGNKRGIGNKGGDPAMFNRIKGGNGRGLTLAEKTLLDALGNGWEWNYVVLTGDSPNFGRGTRPPCYKIDIANPEMMIAVEVDGYSHRGAEEIDAKKQTFLEENGWTVIRVPNRRAIQETSNVVQEICGCQTPGNCPRPARVVSVDPITIPDNYVYDITVEDCHNFYANGILVHNCQDLNRCQQSLAKKAGRRLIMVGDPKQAIYGFAGADAESMPRMKQELGETPEGVEVIPLTVTRRCGKAIVAEANKIVPDFEAFPTNPEGRISYAKYDGAEKLGEAKTEDGGTLTAYSGSMSNGVSYREQVVSGDMVLCRVNAPLVSQCFKFLKAGRKAMIQGRDVGAGLISTIKKLKAADIADLVMKLSEWFHNETKKENAKRNPVETRLIALQDRYDCLSAFIEDQKTVEAVIKRIEDVFTDDRSGMGIKLSSVHKAKGLESSRVFILMPKGAEIPHPMSRSKWQREQEYNILYVAITRAINELTYVTDSGSEVKQAVSRRGTLDSVLSGIGEKHGVYDQEEYEQ